MNYSTRITETVIPLASESGCFGARNQIVDHKIDFYRKAKDQFASAIQFLQISFKNSDTNILKQVKVVIKFPLENSTSREYLRLKIQFENEILMYSKILPMIDMNGIVEEIFSKYCCGTAEPNDNCNKDFVMLEDLSEQRYQLSSDNVFLDYNHCILALKEIGRFHALSYVAKNRNHSEFLKAVSQIKDKWDAGRLQNWKYKLLHCGQRGVLPLINNQESVEILQAFLKNYEDPVKFYLSLVQPIEPEAVLCHGDFCRNNMLFRYSEDGKPVSVKFVDLQTPRYSSPVIDLSFFLLMNTTKETRDKYWNDFLKVYQESVKSVAINLDVPELDFRRVAVYGYLHCSFFLPMMLNSNPRPPLEEFLKLSPYEQGVSMSNIGGSLETQVLIDIIQFLLRNDYIRSDYF